RPPSVPPPPRAAAPVPAVHRASPPVPPQRRSSRPPGASEGLARQPDREAMAQAMRAVDEASIPPPASDEESSESPESSSRAGVARALVRACEEELGQSPDPRRSARLHFEAARLLEVPLWDFGAAVEHYEASRKLWPDHVPTLRGLRRVQTALGRYSTIPSLLDAEIRTTRDPARRALLFYEKGCLLRDYLEDHRGARQAF